MNVVLDMHFDKCSPQFMIRCLRYYVTEYHVDGFLINTAVVSETWLHEDPILLPGKGSGSRIFGTGKSGRQENVCCVQ